MRVTIREATSADLDVVMRHRRSMFADMGNRERAALDAMDASSRPLFARALGDGSGARDPSPQRAWIVNMYTEPGYRRRGLARRLMDEMIGWCRGRRMTTVYLHASDEGRTLYESLGFTPTNEMRLHL